MGGLSAVRYNQSYTSHMKTAVSVPDALFRRAESAARRLRVSRSKLYATALAHYLDRAQAEKITAALNEVYSASPARVDPALHKAQLKSLPKESW